MGYALYAIRGKFIIPLLLLTIGILYSKGIKFKGKRIRLKAGYGVKNVVVGTSWGASISLSLPNPDLTIFTFFTIKLFINSAFFDLKDVERDEIKTLPIILGRKFRPCIGFANVTLYLLTYNHYRNIILLFSFFLSQIAIALRNKKGMFILDFESTLSVFLYLLCQRCFLHN